MDDRARKVGEAPSVKKKLTLSRETLRRLGPTAMHRAAGGTAYSDGCECSGFFCSMDCATIETCGPGCETTDCTIDCTIDCSVDCMTDTCLTMPPGCGDA